MSELLNSPRASAQTIFDSVWCRLVVFFLFYLLYFIFLYLPHGYVLQSHLWNALLVGQTWTYWQEVLTHPGALLEIFSHVFPGFFPSLWTFVLGLSLLSFCTIFLLDGCLQIIKAGRRSLLWPLFLFASIPLCIVPLYDFVYMLVFFFALVVGVRLYLIFRAQRSLRLGVGLFLCVLFYFICGTAFTYLFLLSIGLLEGKKLFSKEGLRAGLAYLVVVGVLPWIAHYWIFVQPLQDLYFLAPSNYAFSRPTIEVGVHFVWAGMGIALLALIAVNAFGHRSPRWLQNSFCKGGIVLLSMGLPFLFTISASERDYYACSHHFRHEAWEQVKTTALAHFQKRPPAQWQQSIAEEFKLSLWMERQLCDSLFYYDYLPSCQYLFPLPMQLNNEIGLWEIYARVGLSGAAAHNAYKMASHATFLHQAGVAHTLEAEIVQGRDPRQHPYFNTLPRGEEWLQEVLSDSLSLKRKQVLSKQAPTLIHPFSLDFSVIALFQNSTYNPYAYDYVCALALIHKDLPQICQWLPQLAKYGYTKIPHHLQEAIALIRLVAQDEDKEAWAGSLADYQIDLFVEQEFQAYIGDKQRLNDQKMGFSEFQQRYMQTYWFYYDFYSPQG